MKRRTKFLMIAAGLLVGCAVAMATGAFSLLPGLSSGGTYQVQHSWPCLDGSPGPLTTLQVTRSASSNGMVDMGFTLEIEALNVLTYARLQTANDANGDGLITRNEWNTVSTASIGEKDGHTFAVAPPIPVAITYDAYRVVMNRIDIGWSAEEVRINPEVDLAMDGEVID